MHPAPNPPSRSVPLRLAALPVFVLLALSVGAAGCDDRDERTISRERFIETMADLRSEAARTPLEGITEEEAEAILTRHGVTEEQLRAFVERHGRNVPMMTEIWNEVERRVQADAEEPDDADELEQGA